MPRAPVLAKNGTKIRCGDVVMNNYASVENPTRVGVVIERGCRQGRMNPSNYIRLSDLEEKTWEIGADNDRLEIVGVLSLDAAAEPEHAPLPQQGGKE